MTGSVVVVHNTFLEPAPPHLRVPLSSSQITGTYPRVYTFVTANSGEKKRFSACHTGNFSNTCDWRVGLITTPQAFEGNLSLAFPILCPGHCVHRSCPLHQPVSYLCSSVSFHYSERLMASERPATSGRLNAHKAPCPNIPTRKSSCQEVRIYFIWFIF